MLYRDEGCVLIGELIGEMVGKLMINGYYMTEWKRRIVLCGGW